ncbi:MAG: hypothetical protein U0528_14660 [Anaerolineae bacterium]
MDAITLSLQINEDRHLAIDLPPESPTGKAILVVVPNSDEGADATNPAREAARAKLLAAGVLSTAHYVEQDNVMISDDDLPITLPPNSLSIDDIINEDRGAY